MFPHTVTLYNTRAEEDQTTFETATVNDITVLRGVLLDATKAVRVGENGLDGADAVTLYIPLSVPTVDGETGEGKRYISPTEFRTLDDRSGYWTLSPGADCFFVKGEAVHPDWTVQQIEAAYDHVYNVTRVDFKDFGGDMSHFEVGGA